MIRFLLALARRFVRARPARVGRALAQRVADRLEGGDVLAHVHRDYCGTGLRHVDGTYVYAQADDGRVASPSEWERRHGTFEDPDRRTNATRAAFVGWLAAQSDASLSGRHLAREWFHDNQRLTVARLTAFADAADSGRGGPTARRRS